MGADDLLAAYDEQLRGRLPGQLPEGVHAERDGPLVRTAGWPHGGFVDYRDLGGLEGAALDELIARQVRFYAGRGESFEWKSHGHDLPADLPDRLHAAGFAAEARETVVVAPASAIAREPVLPAGAILREVTGDADFARIEALEERIWGAGQAKGIAFMLSARRALDPPSLSVFVAEAGSEVLCAAWMRLEHETSFVRLQGGATLPEWRSRGIYRAIVALRANLAVERGYRYLQVDAADASRPILERLGFSAITTTTPFRWCPPG
jgi:hypothetical protein